MVPNNEASLPSRRERCSSYVHVRPRECILSTHGKWRSRLDSDDAKLCAQATNPEPSGSEIQVYPTGVYDSVPTDGITIAFGPEIREQVDTVRAQNCNNRPADECRMALNDVMQKTDVSTHVKRFIPLAAWAFGVLLGLVITEIIYVYNHDLGKGIKFRPEDLQQIHSMAGAQEIAIMTASDASAVAATLTYQPPATTTAT
jgi:hypothetical protein